jgi:hypothetical protein
VDRDWIAAASSASLWNDLEAFLQEHRRCGELDGGVENERIWMACECGACPCPHQLTIVNLLQGFQPFMRRCSWRSR